MINNIINIENPDYPIYKVIKKEYLYEALTSQSFKLFRPGDWEDPFEDVFYNSTSINNHGERINHLYERDRLYGSCWSHLKESDAMWRIYSPEKNGIKIKTTVKKLISALFHSIDTQREKKAFIGKVEYLTTEQIINKLQDEKWVQNIMYDPTNKSKAETLLFKRTEFEHENEIRLIYYEAQRHEVGQYPEFFSLNFQPNDLIEEIELDPRLTEIEYLTIEKKLLTSGYSNRVSKSKLYELPVIYSRINTGEMSLAEAKRMAQKHNKR